MSDLTPTNEETLRGIKAHAKLKNMKVTLIPGKDFGLGYGVDCFVHPLDVSRNELELDREKYFAAWFMEL